MAEEEEIEEKNETGTWKNTLALILLLGAYGLSILKVLSVHEAEIADTKGRAVLRMTHWQLEAGVRDAIDEQARAFEKDYEKETGIKVTIIQNPINEKAYKQYVQTQCIGGTAPDLVEIGFYDEGYTRRFFTPTSEYNGKPNPYNKGTELEKTPWADTFIDGMRSSLDPQTLEYYGASLSVCTVRMFYNKKLLKEATGSVEPPKTYREFLAMCEQLTDWAKKKGIEGFVPVAAASYQLDMFRGRFMSALNFNLALASDMNYDGSLEKTETLISYVDGRHDENSRSIRMGNEAAYALTKHFPNGFMSQNRMESGFRFTRGKSVFIASGAWDANSYIQDADFPVGVCDFPLPQADDPDYGRYISGKSSEASTGGAMRFGVTKFSQNPEVAVRFLMYMTAQKNNEQLNRRFKWIPVTRGAKSFGVMRKFAPDPDGFFSGTFFAGAPRTDAIVRQFLWGYVEHTMDYDTFARNVRREMPRALAADLLLKFRENQENLMILDSSLAWNCGIELFVNDWGLPTKAAERESTKTDRRVEFLWESRAGNLATIQMPLIFKQQLAAENPMAKKVLSYMTQNPFANME